MSVLFHLPVRGPEVLPLRLPQSELTLTTNCLTRHVTPQINIVTLALVGVYLIV